MSNTGKTDKQGKRKYSIFLTSLLLAVVVFCVFSVAHACADISKSNDEIAQIQSDIAAIKAENDRSQRMLDNSDLEDYIIKIAHDKFGLVFPDERVYYYKELAEN